MSGGKKSEEIPTRILLTQDVRIKQERLVANCDKEVMWVGLVDQVEAGGYNYLRVYDILVPRQVVTGSSVEWEGSMNDLLLEMVEQGRGDEIECMKYFGHSHVDMSVFHSGTDMKQVWSYAEVAELDWFISAVYNKKNECTHRLDMFRPFRMHVNECKVVNLTPPALNTWAKDQLAKNVIERQRQIGFTNTHSYTQGVNYALTLKRANEMYPDDHVSIHIANNQRYLVVDGEIVGCEHQGTGELMWMEDDAEKRWDETEPEVTTQPTISRSIQRSEEKRAEGNSEGERTGVRSPIPTASEAERRQPDEQPKLLSSPASELIPEEVIGEKEIDERSNLDDDSELELLRLYDEIEDLNYAMWFSHGYM